MRELAALWERTAGLLADELHRHSLASGQIVQQHVLAELQAAAVANMRLKVWAAPLRPLRSPCEACNAVCFNDMVPSIVTGVFDERLGTCQRRGMGS